MIALAEGRMRTPRASLFEHVIGSRAHPALSAGVGRAAPASLDVLQPFCEADRFQGISVVLEALAQGLRFFRWHAGVKLGIKCLERAFGWIVTPESMNVTRSSRSRRVFREEKVSASSHPAPEHSEHLRLAGAGRIAEWCSGNGFAAPAASNGGVD